MQAVDFLMGCAVLPVLRLSVTLLVLRSNLPSFRIAITFNIGILFLRLFVHQQVDDGLVYYKQVVAELCAECQVFDSWFVHLEEQIQRNGEWGLLFA